MMALSRLLLGPLRRCLLAAAPAVFVTGAAELDGATIAVEFKAFEALAVEAEPLSAALLLLFDDAAPASCGESFLAASEAAMDCLCVVGWAFADMRRAKADCS